MTQDTIWRDKGTPASEKIGTALCKCGTAFLVEKGEVINEPWCYSTSLIKHAEQLQSENAALKDRVKELEMAKIDFIKNFTGVDKLQDRIKALESVLGKAKTTTDTILHAESLCQPWESVSIDKTIDLLKQLSTEIEQTLKG